MCTVSFIARKNGYALAMNRDESLTRVAGLPPKRFNVNGRSVIYPSEPQGGTWIALNDTGATLALINWYAVKERVRGDAVSRGEIVKTVCGADGTASVDTELARLPLSKMNPFRLIGIFPVSHEVYEWRWDLKKLAIKKHSWTTQQWISSGYNEPKAQRIRSETFKQALTQRSAGSLNWLRRLHRSHAPQCGPFSICMHRSDAQTVSYTEVSVSNCHAKMGHYRGSPCDLSASLNIRILSSVLYLLPFMSSGYSFLLIPD